jgi:four helix bundle protein
MQDFRKLKVWQKGHQATLDVYRVTKSFPKEETYGITSQIRRCAASVPANIAEGCGRGSDADFGRFLNIAMGSASELEYFALLAHDLGYLSSQSHEAIRSQTEEIKRMLASLHRRTKGAPGAPPTQPPPTKTPRNDNRNN